MGLVALLATSCNKNKDQQNASLQSYGEQMEVVAGEFDDNSEKVTLGTDNRLYFESGEACALFYINTTTPANSAWLTCTTTGGQVDGITTWTPMGGGTLPEVESRDRYAFSPAGTCTYDGKAYVTTDSTFFIENRATFHIPAHQTYVENSCPTEGFFMASKLEAGQSSFYFRNICGLLCLQIYSPMNRTVTSIEVTDKDGKHLSGDVSLKIDKVNPTTLRSLYNNYNPDNASYMQTLADYIEESGYCVSNAGATMTLDCGGSDGVQVGTSSGSATKFYITLRPLALRKGFVVKVNCTGGYSFTQQTSKSNIIGPNVIKKMPAFNIK